MEPTKVEYYDLGVVFSRIWMRDGVLHREDRPAYIEYYPDGKILQENWYFEGNLHRSDGPAYIRYYPDGKFDFHFYRNGHCINGQVLEYMRENDLRDPLNISLEHRVIIKMKFF